MTYYIYGRQMNIIIALPLSVLIALSMLITVIVITTAIDEFCKLREKQKQINQIDDKIKVYEIIASQELDNVEKAYWIARAMNCKYERNCL